MPSYEPASIEAKWQKRWEADSLFYSASTDDERPRYYFLTMFPYPSGALHCGHWFMYAAPDARARFLRMTGHNVFFPMGFDAFGLPAENAAIKRNINPKDWTFKNIAQMRESFRRMGASFTWDNTLITCAPEFYRWTQWLFLQLLKGGMAYRKHAPVDWCPSCNTTLAREQVIGEARLCERCQSPVTKRDLDQWFFRITRYADELLDYSGIDWPERVKLMQTNWIGRNEGATVRFATTVGTDIEVFTTRVDTVFGVVFCAVAPEHPLVADLTMPEHREAVEAYGAQARHRNEIERMAADREKTGVFTGAYCTNPVNGERIPVFVADYVLGHYGTGAVMGVPAHDERDYVFAQKYELPIRPVIRPPALSSPPILGGETALQVDELDLPFTEDGVLFNSGKFANLTSEEGRRAITDWLLAEGRGRFSITYRLRDWLVSRQRYWGAPIPIVYCSACGAIPVPQSELPVLLPDDVQFIPTGESPLKFHQGFLHTQCPKCGRPAERETDTMDTFVDSSWYWFRYLSPHDAERFVDPEAAHAWLPVNHYAGGIEHATMHLLYARFFTKALRDLGFGEHGEPFLRLFNQGLIQGEDGEKMSKSRGNVVDPDREVERYGSDILRTFLMFIGPWERGGPWNSSGIEGVSRFYNRLWTVVTAPAGATAGSPSQTEELQRITHRTIGRVTRGLQNFEFNTAIAALMEFVNALVKARADGAGGAPWNEAIRALVLLLAPFGPHAAEQLWEMLGNEYSVHQQSWPVYNEKLAASKVVTIVIQVNGKLRDRVELPADSDQESVVQAARAAEKVSAALQGREPDQIIFVPNRLVNFVVR